MTTEIDETTAYEPDTSYVQAGLNSLAREANRLATEKGWNEQDKGRSIAELIALMHSELSEALEDYRLGYAPTDIYYELDAQGRQKPCGIPIEFADAIIRITQACGKLGIDIGAAVLEKHAYNVGRPRRHGGKVI